MKKIHGHNPIKIKGYLDGIKSKLDVNINSPLTAFGELSVDMICPTVQIDAIYGVLNTDVETFTSGGSATVSDGLFTCQSGTGSADYGVLRSKRIVKYRPGQGTICRYTAMFTSGVADSLQLAGLFSSNCGLWFGYNGADFGICRRSKGLFEVQKLTISTGATSNNNVDITLNGVTTTIALTNSSAQENAYEIASTSFTGWETQQIDDTVIFNYLLPQPLAGSFTYDPLSSGSSASFSEITNGVVNELNWTLQTAWNVDRCDGTNGSNNPSGFNLDTTKLNVYQICFKYLGAGGLDFFVENNNTNRMILVHQIKYSNLNTVPSLINPNMPIGWSSSNSGNTTNLTVKGASAMGATHGKIVYFRNPRSYSNTRTSVSTTELNIFTLKNLGMFVGKINQRELIPEKLILANESNKPAIINVRIDASLSGVQNYQYIEENESSTIVESTSSNVTNGRVVFSVSLAKSDSISIELDFLKLKLEAKQTLTIGAYLTSGTGGEIDASLVWFED